MSWPLATLASLCEINMGKTPSRHNAAYWGEGHPWLSIADMNQGLQIFETKESITQKAVEECNCKPVEPGTVLLSFKLSIGKVGIANRRLFTNEAIAALPVKNSSQLDSSYLSYALRAIDLTDGLDRAAKGLTLNKDKLERIKLPLPPLPEQRRIAAILDKADALRTKRREALAQLDSLTQSIFIEMFGDPVTNPKGWKTEPLGAVVKTTSGGTPDRSAQGYYGGTIPWVKSGELHQRLVTETEEHITELGLANSSAKLMPPGTVLVAMYGATVGAVSELAVHAATNQAICCMQPSKSILSSYLIAFMKHYTPTLLMRRVGGAQPNLSQDLLRNIRIPLPSVDLQREFDRRLGSVLRIESEHQKASILHESLFASLQHRAFRGEL